VKAVKRDKYEELTHRFIRYVQLSSKHLCESSNLARSGDIL